MGPYIVRPREPHASDSIDMGDGITVTMPGFVGGPHRWSWGDPDARPHQILNCSCGWQMRWSGYMQPEADRVWQAHRNGRDDN